MADTDGCGMHFTHNEIATLKELARREERKRQRKSTVLRYGAGLLIGAALMWLAGTMGWI